MPFGIPIRLMVLSMAAIPVLSEMPGGRLKETVLATRRS
jgi:hypothetical protein